MRNMSEDYFTRELEICSCNKSLTFYQQVKGDVSCVVWDAALVLAKYLEARCNEDEKNCLRGRSVLELGAGLGCVGLAAACFGAHVTMTDLPEAMPLLQKNVDENQVVWNTSGGRVFTEVLKWGSGLPNGKAADLVLLADCVYYMESVEPLVKTLCLVTDSATEVLISQEERDSEIQQNVWKTFWHLIQRHFDFTAVPEHEQHPQFSSSDIVVLRGRKKNT